MGPPIGGHLEHGEPEMLKDLYEERVQREPHPKSQVGL